MNNVNGCLSMINPLSWPPLSKSRVVTGQHTLTGQWAASWKPCRASNFQKSHQPLHRTLVSQKGAVMVMNVSLEYVCLDGWRKEHRTPKPYPYQIETPIPGAVQKQLTQFSCTISQSCKAPLPSKKHNNISTRIYISRLLVGLSYGYGVPLETETNADQRVCFPFLLFPSGNPARQEGKKPYYSLLEFNSLFVNLEKTEHFRNCWVMMQCLQQRTLPPTSACSSSSFRARAFFAAPTNQPTAPRLPVAVWTTYRIALG